MLHPVNLLIAGGFLAFIIVDTIWPARQFPSQKLWRVRGLIAAAAFLALATYTPFLWTSWLGGPLLFDLTATPLWAQALIGYAAVQFCSYWWHRALHKFDVLWRVFHQMHHSVERMDGWGALYHHPFDVTAFTFVGAFALTMIVGIGPEAAAISGVFGMLAVFFTHCNIKTPKWIGWIMQRPEGHGLHHQRGRHAGNYAELVIWDMLFGTYENPKFWNGEAGFYDGASLRIWEMLTFRDVSRPKDKCDDDELRSRRLARQAGQLNPEIGYTLVAISVITVSLFSIGVAVDSLI